MSYLIVFLFALNGQLAHVYLGETKSEAACIQKAREDVPKVLPGLNEGMILCVKKLET